MSEVLSDLVYSTLGGDSLLELHKTTYLFALSSCSATCLMVYEWLLTFDDECKYILTKPNCFPVKWLYLYSRYLGIVAQIVSNIATSGLPVGEFRVFGSCKSIVTYQAFATQSMLISLDIILFIRVHALYNHSRLLGRILTLTVMAEFIITVCSCIVARNLSFNHLCIVTEKPPEVFYAGIAPALTQIFIFVLTFFKHMNFAKKGCRPPVMQRLITDGAFVFIVLCGIIVASVMPGTFQRASVFLLLPWALSILSIAGCRLIIRMQRLKVDKLDLDGELASRSLELTSIFGTATFDTSDDFSISEE